MGAVVSLIFCAPEMLRIVGAAPWEHTAKVAYMGVFPSALGYLSWVKALSIAPKTSLVTNYMFLTPWAALIFEFAVTRTFPDTATILGGVIILAALVLFAWYGRK